jgi:TrmH family RNA methyltransferase
VKPIASRHNPVVARYRAAARGEARDVLLLDGVRLVADAIAAGARIREAAITAESTRHGVVQEMADRLSGARVPVSVVTESVMDALSPVRAASGIVALADRPAVDADALLHRNVPLVAVAVDVQDPGNVGAIVRVAEAAGASGVLAAGASADPFGWKALRGSMGSALRLPIAVERDAAVAIEIVRRAGCRVVATVPRSGHAIERADYTGPTAVLIGGEGQGLSAAIVDAADERVTIPMAAPVESLNAAVTAALILYEARRQRSNMIGRYE